MVETIDCTDNSIRVLKDNLNDAVITNTIKYPHTVPPEHVIKC